MRQSESEAGRLAVYSRSSDSEVTYLADFAQGRSAAAPPLPSPSWGGVWGWGERTKIQVTYVHDQA